MPSPAKLEFHADDQRHARHRRSAHGRTAPDHDQDRRRQAGRIGSADLHRGEDQQRAERQRRAPRQALDGQGLHQRRAGQCVCSPTAAGSACDPHPGRLERRCKGKLIFFFVDTSSHACLGGALHTGQVPPWTASYKQSGTNLNVTIPIPNTVDYPLGTSGGEVGSLSKVYLKWASSGLQSTACSGAKRNVHLRVQGLGHRVQLLGERLGHRQSGLLLTQALVHRPVGVAVSTDRGAGGPHHKGGVRVEAHHAIAIATMAVGLVAASSAFAAVNNYTASYKFSGRQGDQRQTRQAELHADDQRHARHRRAACTGILHQITTKIDNVKVDASSAKANDVHPGARSTRPRTTPDAIRRRRSIAKGYINAQLGARPPTRLRPVRPAIRYWTCGTAVPGKLVVLLRRDRFAPVPGRRAAYRARSRRGRPPTSRPARTST